AVFELVADERQIDAEHFAAQRLLQQVQEGVDSAPQAAYVEHAANKTGQVVRFDFEIAAEAGDFGRGQWIVNSERGGVATSRSGMLRNMRNKIRRIIGIDVYVGQVRKTSADDDQRVLRAQASDRI